MPRPRKRATVLGVRATTLTDARHARAARHRRLHRTARAEDRRAHARSRAPEEPVPAPDGDAAAAGGRREEGHGPQAARQADRDRPRGRSPPRDPPDDLGAAAIPGHRRGDTGEARPRGIRFFDRHAAPHRSRNEEAGLAASRSRRGGGRALDPGGLEVLDADLAAFEEALARESHTLKRALTDPRLFSGIGNAYSDEILHRAKLSPMKLGGSLDAEETERLFRCVKETLLEWTDRLRREAGDGFPEKVTAFHDGMAVHGRYGKPCPACGTPVQRIVYAENEANYCPTCQTGGRLLADRALSRLLRGDWPRTIEELEAARKPTS